MIAGFLLIFTIRRNDEKDLSVNRSHAKLRVHFNHEKTVGLKIKKNISVYRVFPFSVFILDWGATCQGAKSLDLNLTCFYGLVSLGLL